MATLALRNGRVLTDAGLRLSRSTMARRPGSDRA